MIFISGGWDHVWARGSGGHSRASVRWKYCSENWQEGNSRLSIICACMNVVRSFQLSTKNARLLNRDKTSLASFRRTWECIFFTAAAVLSSFENPDKKCEKNLAVKGFSFYTSSSIWWRLGTVMKWSRVKISLYASKVGWGGRLRKGATWHSKIALLSHYFLVVVWVDLWDTRHNCIVRGF